MCADFDIRSAGSEDLEAVTGLLVECGLPAEGVEEHLEHGYVVAEHGAEIIGVCGIEVHGAYGLLRSLAVFRPWRGRSVGRALADDRIAWAKAQNIPALYLLTIDAGDYFERLGFSRVGRDDVPPEIGRSCEFRSLCPDTAVAMVRRLGDQGREKPGPSGGDPGTEKE